MGTFFIVILWLYVIGAILYHAVKGIEKLSVFVKRKIIPEAPRVEPAADQLEVKSKLERERFEFSTQTIKHMIEVVEHAIRNNTNQNIKVPWPETEDDKAKLKEMYDRALAKYS